MIFPVYQPSPHDRRESHANRLRNWRNNCSNHWKIFSPSSFELRVREGFRILPNVNRISSQNSLKRANLSAPELSKIRPYTNIYTTHWNEVERRVCGGRRGGGSEETIWSTRPAENGRRPTPRSTSSLFTRRPFCLLAVRGAPQRAPDM